jgi:sec-independent protein translocase protein TatA
MFTNFAFGDFSTIDLLIILLVVLLLFGAKKLPELSRSVGESMRELRKGVSDSGNEKKNTDNPQSNDTQNQ